MNIVTGEGLVVAPEVAASIRERLPKLCAAMAELAIQRVEALGLESPFCSGRWLSHVAFFASYYDPDMPHSDTYKSSQKKRLESTRKNHSECPEIVTASEQKWLSELEAYNALPVEQKVGGVAGAYFTIDDSHPKKGTWDLTDIGAATEYMDFPERGPAEPDFRNVYIKENEIRTAQPMYEGPANVEALLRAIDIFEKAKEEDIHVTLPVTL